MRFHSFRVSPDEVPVVFSNLQTLSYARWAYMRPLDVRITVAYEQVGNEYQVRYTANLPYRKGGDWHTVPFCRKTGQQVASGRPNFTRFVVEPAEEGNVNVTFFNSTGEVFRQLTDIAPRINTFAEAAAILSIVNRSTFEELIES